MNRDRRVRIYDLHSWTGITLGLVIFVISFTGCLALFHHEILTWEDPARRLDVPANPVAIDPLAKPWIEQNTAGLHGIFVSVSFPSVLEPYYSSLVQGENDDHELVRSERRWNASTGEVLPERGAGLSTWLLDFHRDLMWPDALGGRTIGRALVGVGGIILMLSIVTGLVTHRKMLRELFTLRFGRSLRLQWKDIHNIIGLWGLPFHIMIAFTGAFLGVVALLLPIMAALTVKGDTEKLVEVLGLGGAEPAGISAPMLSFDTVAQLLRAGDNQYPTSVFVTAWGDENAEYQVNYVADAELLIIESERRHGVTGEPLVREPVGADPATVTGRVLSAIAPLHYATYGGVSLKLLYFVLGLGLALLAVFGNMVWIERRWHSSEGQRSDVFYRRLSQFTAGISLGVVMASLALFYLDKLYAGAESQRLFWTGVTYFVTWFGTLMVAMSVRNVYATVRYGIACIALTLLLIPVLNFIVTQDAVWQLVNQATPSRLVDLTLIVSALLLFTVCWHLPTQRKDPTRRRHVGVESVAPRLT